MLRLPLEMHNLSPSLYKMLCRKQNSCWGFFLLKNSKLVLIIPPPNVMYELECTSNWIVVYLLRIIKQQLKFDRTFHGCCCCNWLLYYLYDEKYCKKNKKNI